MTADQTTVTSDAADGLSAVPPLTGPQTVTDELIASIGTSQCGWSKRQLKILGVSWPPPAGWRQCLVAEGHSLTGEEVEALYDARKKPKRTAEIVELPCPWCSRLVQRVEQGGHTREFCNKRHKVAFNNALTKASIEFSRLLRVPSALQAWSLARVNPSPDGGDALPRVTKAVGQQDTASATLDDDLPF